MVSALCLDRMGRLDAKESSKVVRETDRGLPHNWGNVLNSKSCCLKTISAHLPPGPLLFCRFGLSLSFDSLGTCCDLVLQKVGGALNPLSRYGILFAQLCEVCI